MNFKNHKDQSSIAVTDINGDVVVLAPGESCEVRDPEPKKDTKKQGKKALRGDNK